MTISDTEAAPAAIEALLGQVERRISAQRARDIIDWLDHREWELALDLLADSIFDSQIELGESELRSLHEALSAMKMPLDKYGFLTRN